MCATPRLKHQALLVARAADVAAHTAFFSVPAAVVKAILSAPMPGAVVGAPMAVAALPAAAAKMARTVVGVSLPMVKRLNAPVVSEAKASMECAPETADTVPAEVVAMPAPVPKAPGPFHPISVVVEILGTEMGDQGCSCEEYASNCSKVMAENVVVHLHKVQIQVEGLEEMAIAAYWVTEGVNCSHVGFLPCHMVRHAARYDGALAKVTHVFHADLTCCDTVECRLFHKNKGCCLAAITAW
jgi:hypothetical protein